MKIYCLNLERAVERREMITEEWIKKRGFNIEFFKAFDRRQVELREFVFPYNEATAIERIKRPLSKGEIACATSHCLLLQKALEEGHEEIIVMEDDCMPYDNATVGSVMETINKCKTVFPKVKVFLMHDYEGYDVKIIETKEGINLLSYPPFGCRFVWLQKKAIEILMKDLSTMCYPADWLWTKRFAPMKVIAGLEKPFGNHHGNNSYIGKELRNCNRIFIP